MFYGLVNVTYFDLVTVGFTFAVLIAVQILNALWALKDKGSVDCTDNCASVVGDDNFRKLLKINENGTEVAEKTPPILHKRSPSSPVTTATSVTSPAATPPPTTKNGKLQKQQSEQCEKYVSN